MEQRTEIRACPHCRTGNRVLLSKRALAKAYCGRCRQPLQLTYYEVLGVPRDADAAAIKRAYRALAAAWHPDRNASKHAAEVFSYLTEAYRILVHPERRQAYDTMLAQAAERSAGAPDASRAAAAAGGHNRAARAGDTAA
ncbi:DnaJ domain-containing protein, partial [Alicyclobacillus cellulosilyticus]|uniref:DnaJ domain-containing protein n=1 Tax=Alicyclobacillus cellulosilyticus TaxID=1003997 RepID=UPI0035714690